jgi:hypothetical protein
LKVAKDFKCTDCGHSHSKPWPSPDHKPATAAEGSNIPDELNCYVTKTVFGDKIDDKIAIFGFGISKTGSPNNPQLTSPCEFMTLDGFLQLQASGKVESVMREELHYFLPLCITPEHATRIQSRFESVISKLAGDDFRPVQVLQILPKLMNSTVVAFMNGTTHTSERALHGYFQFHRLFLWALNTYPNLVGEVDKRVKGFITDPANRLKKVTPNVGEWLALLTVSPVTWEKASYGKL